MRVALVLGVCRSTTSRTTKRPAVAIEEPGENDKVGAKPPASEYLRDVVDPDPISTTSRSPFANVLHSETVERLASDTTLVEGRLYASNGRVKALNRVENQLVAVVEGQTFYAVSLWIRGDGLGYTCTCPRGVEGDFCKHCVAVTLVWLERNPVR